MKIFRSETVQEDNYIRHEFYEQLKALEDTLGECRQIVGQRRIMLHNAEKKLQEYQDSIYAMLIEEDNPKRKRHFSNEDDDGEDS
jgi:hypothetical protein